MVRDPPTITSIQKLTHHNAGLLANLCPEVFDHPINPEQLTAFLNDPRHVMFLASDGSSVVGMASAVEYFHPDKPPQLWINEVGVTTSRRNQGIGRKLVDALVQYAKDRGCSYAWLGTDSTNTAAQKCFGGHPDVEEPQSFLLYEWELGH